MDASHTSETENALYKRKIIRIRKMRPNVPKRREDAGREAAMPRQCASVKSVEQFIGHAVSRPDGDNEKPYGKCYGQVCGQYYPELQREYIDPKKKALEERKAANKAVKADYQRAKRVAHNAKKVRCVETGEVFNSLKDAAEFAGVPAESFRKMFSKHCGSARIYGYTFVAVRL